MMTEVISLPVCVPKSSVGAYAIGTHFAHQTSILRHHTRLSYSHRKVVSPYDVFKTLLNNSEMTIHIVNINHLRTVSLPATVSKEHH
jgi:hypothetical protein